MDSKRPATEHRNEKSTEPIRIRKTLKGEGDMKAKAMGRDKGWLTRKLVNSNFRKGFEEELRKLAIGEQLARLRQEAGLTQSQVAKRTGTTASAISRYESADYDRYELRTLQKIAVACGGRLEISFERGSNTHRAA
jgi:DNA-binding XRE family transcriptional regulator